MKLSTLQYIKSGFSCAPHCSLVIYSRKRSKTSKRLNALWNCIHFNFSLIALLFVVIFCESEWCKWSKNKAVEKSIDITFFVVCRTISVKAIYWANSRSNRNYSFWMGKMHELQQFSTNQLKIWIAYQSG